MATPIGFVLITDEQYESLNPRPVTIEYQGRKAIIETALHRLGSNVFITDTVQTRPALIKSSITVPSNVKVEVELYQLKDYFPKISIDSNKTYLLAKAGERTPSWNEVDIVIVLDYITQKWREGNAVSLQEFLDHPNETEEEYIQRQVAEKQQMISMIFNKRIEGVKTELLKYEDEITKSEETLAQKYVKYKELEKKLKNLKSETIEAEYISMLKVTNGEICLEFDTGNIIYKFGKKFYLLGKYHVTVKLTGTDIAQSLKIKNTTLKLEDSSCNHPHVNSSESCCLGSFKERIAEHLVNKDIKMLIEEITFFLTSYNESNCYSGTAMINWPEVENGKVVNWNGTKYIGERIETPEQYDTHRAKIYG